MERGAVAAFGAAVIEVVLQALGIGRDHARDVGIADDVTCEIEAPGQDVHRGERRAGIGPALRLAMLEIMEDGLKIPLDRCRDIRVQPQIGCNVEIFRQPLAGGSSLTGLRFASEAALGPPEFLPMPVDLVIRSMAQVRVIITIKFDIECRILLAYTEARQFEKIHLVPRSCRSLQKLFMKIAFMTMPKLNQYCRRIQFMLESPEAIFLSHCKKREDVRAGPRRCQAAPRRRTGAGGSGRSPPCPVQGPPAERSPRESISRPARNALERPDHRS